MHNCTFTTPEALHELIGVYRESGSSSGDSGGGEYSSKKFEHKRWATEGRPCESRGASVEL